MATTTNYGWTTPDDTALVKDGASAIRTLGSSVDTTTKNLNPSTTAGDIEYRSSTANVNTRLALGTAGQVLAVNSGATAPEWQTINAGGMTLISTTTLTGATVTLSSIPQTYNSLYLVIQNFRPSVDGDYFTFRFNGISTTTYREQLPYQVATDYTKAGDDKIGNSFQFLRSDNTTTLGIGSILIENYTNTVTNKTALFRSISNDSANPSTTWRFAGGVGTSTATSAITSLDFLTTAGTFTSGTVLLYGVK
jgi:hypothetical protein